MKRMRILKPLTALTLAAAFLAAPFTGLAADNSKAKAKPYTLKTCPVTDEKLGEMGKPYVFEHEGREIKLCCKSCLKDFKKDPAKFVKKIEAAEAKDAKAKK
jgi:YHS domain-containing protein